MFGTKEELEKWETGKISDNEKLMAAYALNLCTVSVSQIVDYSDLVILEQEYEAILNNLNLENFPKDEALLDILKQILDTITFFRIQEGDKKFIDLEYQQKMKNAIWSAVPNFGVIIAGGMGNPWAMGAALASQVGIGYMNYRKEKANNQLEYEKQKWQLQRSAIEQFNALRRELFTTAWRLADKYDFKDEYRLTEKQISQYNDILMDRHTYRKYERLCAIKENFEAYPPFWYYLGNAANAIAQKYYLSEDDKKDNLEKAQLAGVYNEEIVRINQNEETYIKYKKLAIEHFNQYWKVNNLPLLRKDDIAASCALEHIDLLMQEGIEPNKEKINELLGIAIKNAGNSWDIIQLCTMNYLRLGNFEEAKKYLRVLVTEDYNAPFNAQILSKQYVEEAIEKNDVSYNYSNFATLCRFVNDSRYLYPWPNTIPTNDEEKKVIFARFLLDQKSLLQNKYAFSMIKLVEKYTVILNRQTQCPADDYEKEYTDSYFLDIPNKIKKRKEDCDRFGVLVSSKRELGYIYVNVFYDFVKAVKTLPLFSQINEEFIIEKLKDEKIANFFDFGKSEVKDDKIDDIFDERLHFVSIASEFIKEMASVIEDYFAINNAIDGKEINKSELDLFNFCAKETLPLPSLEFDNKEEASKTDAEIKISFGNIWGKDAEEYVKQKLIIEKQLEVLKSYKKELENEKGKLKILIKGEKEFIDYVAKNKLESREEILAIFDDKTQKNEDLFFFSGHVLLQEGNSPLKVGKAIGNAAKDVAIANIGVKGVAKILGRGIPLINMPLLVGDGVVAYNGFVKGLNNRKHIKATYHDLKQNGMEIKIGDYIYDNSFVDVSKFNEMVAKLASNIPQDKSIKTLSSIECLKSLLPDETKGTVE
ncbi:MAG: hypothetical protein E7059_06900 [Treponema bryantii]|nr:hypothetical protein [Treponema bryantii]